MNILISACLLGINCRYDGTGGKIEEIEALMKNHHLIPICAETLGGLPTPRIPCEIQGKFIINREGVDVTEAFHKGAEEVLKLAKLYNCSRAILKAKSPSCGYGLIYDGSFSGTLKEGNGILAQLLIDNKIEVIVK